MKKIIQILFICFLAVVIGFSLSGCGSVGGIDEGDDGDGGDGGEDPAPQPSFNFTGTVYGQNGSPFGGVGVYVFSPDYTATTNASGIFALNIAAGEHVLLTSRPGYLDSYQIFNLPEGGSESQPVLLLDAPVTPVNVLAATGTTTPIVSNSVDDSTATLSIPAQNPASFAVNGQTRSSESISLINVDLNAPLPVPLPSPATLAPENVVIGGKQAPVSLVSIQPALLNMNTAATLDMPNPVGIGVTRILRFDPETHRWQPVVNTAGTTAPILQGGVYGIFYEEQRIGSIRGSAAPGSVIWIAGEMVEVGADGTFFFNEVPIPPEGPVQVVGLGPADPETGIRSPLQSEVDLQPGEQATINLTQVDIGGIEVTTESETLVADGESTVEITANLTDEGGNPISGETTVFFSTSAGTLSANQVRAVNGTARVTLISSGTAGEIANVTGSAGGFSDSVSIRFLPRPESFSLSTSQTSVKTDNSDSAIITATVLNSNNAPFAGVPVSFQVESGVLRPVGELPEGEQFDPTSVITGSDGTAQVRFSSGTGEEGRENRTVTINVKVSGLPPKTIPIQVAGTTIELDNDKTNLNVEGGDTATVTVTVRDASLSPIFDAPVNIDVTPPGSLNVTTADGGPFRTDISGKLELEVAGAQPAEEAVLEVTSLGVTKTQTYTVTSAANTFAIISPNEDPFALSTNTQLPVVVQAPNQSQVRFSTSFGTWENGSQVMDVNVVDRRATANLSSAEAGVATVQVFDLQNPSTSDSMQVVISAPSSEASQLSLQVSSRVVAPSTGDVQNTVTLRATVKNPSDQPVGGAPVAFSLVRTTGGGESISPVIVFTNSQGVATSTFFSGSLPSDANGVTIRAVVVGKEASVNDTIAVVIGGTAGSVLIGRGTEISSNDENTAYILPMSVIVSDSNGNPVSGAQVTLGVWPVEYSTGFWTPDPPCTPVITGTFPNEDENRNLIEEPGEDVNDDGQLTPPNSAAGNVIPAVVTTDDNGVATFNLEYLKASAVWIVDEITATTLVAGTETQSRLEFRLPFLEGEECNLPNSPFVGREDLAEIEVFASPSRLLANGKSESLIAATLVGENGAFADAGTLVQFRITQGGGTLSQTTASISENGTATVTYTAPQGTTQGTEAVITVTSPLFESISGSVTIELGTGSLLLSADGPTTLPADGESEVLLRAQLFGLDGELIETPDRVEFSLNGPGGFPSSDFAVEFASGGTAEVTYVAGTTPGTATITATMETGASDSVTITLEGEAPEEISFILPLEVDPEGSIPADGSTSVSITATVINTAGEPVREGTPVTFTTNLGQFSDGSQSKTVTTADDSGQVVISLSSDQAGIAKVTAEAAGVTQSTTIRFEGGEQGDNPIGETFTIRADGSTSPVTLTVTADDIFGNAVTDGTIIDFNTFNTGGSLNPETAFTENGIATSTLTFDPAALPISVTALADGASTTHVTSLAVVPVTAFSQTVYAGTSGGGIYRSTDSGQTWENVTRSATIPGQNWIQPYVNDVAVDPDNPNTVYAGTGFFEDGTLYKSTNAGRTWDSGSIYGIADADSAVLSILADGGSQYVWFGTERNGLFYSSNNGESFQQAMGTAGRTVNDIVKVAGSGPSAVLYAGTDQGVFRSTTGGQIWTERGNFTGEFITSLAAHPSANGGGSDILYAGTAGVGVWISTDSGNSWTQFTGGFDITNGSINVQDVLVDAKNNFLYAVTVDGEPSQATGSAYVRDLEDNGTIGPGEWRKANSGISEPLPAMYVIEAVPDTSGDPTSPRALMLGTDGIDLFKANSGLDIGDPQWQTSSTGLTNRIMTRTIIPATEDDMTPSQ